MNIVSASALSCFLSLSSVVGCAYEDHSHRHWDDDAPIAVPPSDEMPPAANGAPMLVEIETDQTMNAEGGEGVGVFVEYFKGGHWHIWWSCDTKRTAQSCDFTIGATALTGAISKVDTSELRGGVAREKGGSRVDVTSTTTTELRGIRFDTDAGATITLDAAIGGLSDGSFLFFVQDGQVNGGFAGQLTNPLQLRGTIP